MHTMEWPGIRSRVLQLLCCAMFAAGFGGSAAAQCIFDIDGNGQVDALTDGMLILRAGLGMTGAALTQGALGPNASRTDPTAILNLVNSNKATQYDLDGSGAFDSATDGTMIMRIMLGLTGDSVTAGATANSSPRADWNSIDLFVQGGCGAGPSAQLKDAARFLTQATWGPTHAEILALASSPPPQVDNWITQQFAQPRVNHLDFINARAALGTVSTSDTYQSFWTQALTGPDQLRQCVNYALSQIIVVSDQKDALVNSPWAIAGYYDALAKNSFGNFRTLLEDITKNPGMAIYLDWRCNEGQSAASLPNENYARELMQLFSIGTVWLNQDGTPMLDGSGNPIPTYDQSVVQGFAKVFTGWANAGTYWCHYPDTPGWSDPMIPWQGHHSLDSKKLLSLTPPGPNVVLAAQTPATENAQADLTAALDNIFNHPNVAPYIGKQLIKFLVTSNPSSGYVSRVAAKFNDNGSGVRGDLQAVIRAVLTDTEARDLTVALGPTFGKLREPAMRFGNMLRTFHATAASQRIRINDISDPRFGMGQQPLSSPTVFNFYPFDYSPPGPLGSAVPQLLGPEFGITDSTTLVTFSNNMKEVIFAGWISGPDELVLDYASLASLATVPTDIADYLNLVMAGGVMSPTTYAQIVFAVAQVPMTGSSWQSDRWKNAIWILFNSPEYIIQR